VSLGMLGGSFSAGRILGGVSLGILCGDFSAGRQSFTPAHGDSTAYLVQSGFRGQ
jgi:hypothetical protein